MYFISDVDWHVSVFLHIYLTSQDILADPRFSYSIIHFYYVIINCDGLKVWTAV